MCSPAHFSQPKLYYSCVVFSGGFEGCLCFALYYIYGSGKGKWQLRPYAVLIHSHISSPVHSPVLLMDLIAFPFHPISIDDIC